MDSLTEARGLPRWRPLPLETGPNDPPPGVWRRCPWVGGQEGGGGARSWVYVVSDLESALSVRVTEVEADEGEEDERYLIEPPEDGPRIWVPGVLEGGNGMEDNDGEGDVVEVPLVVISSDDEQVKSEGEEEREGQEGGGGDEGEDDDNGNERDDNDDEEIPDKRRNRQPRRRHQNNPLLPIVHVSPLQRTKIPHFSPFPNATTAIPTPSASIHPLDIPEKNLMHNYPQPASTLSLPPSLSKPTSHVQYIILTSLLIVTPLINYTYVHTT